MLNVSKLSKLQKRILEEGLKAHRDERIHRAWGNQRPARFGISQILEEFFGVNEEDIDRPYGRWRWARAQNRLARKRLAAPRAAISRAMSRLSKRGLLERISPTCRGGWRLSAPGVEAALRVYPNLQEPARVQTIRRIKEIFDQRKKPSLLWQPLSAEVTLRDFIASVLPERKSSLRKPQRNKTRQGVHVEFVGLD
jgi:hypothetical protein